MRERFGVLGIWGSMWSESPNHRPFTCCFYTQHILIILLFLILCIKSHIKYEKLILQFQVRKSIQHFYFIPIWEPKWSKSLFFFSSPLLGSLLWRVQILGSKYNALSCEFERKSFYGLSLSSFHGSFGKEKQNQKYFSKLLRDCIYKNTSLFHEIVFFL